MNGYLVPHWEHPVGTRCSCCEKPITIMWTSTAVGHDICYRITNPLANPIREQETHR